MRRRILNGTVPPCDIMEIHGGVAGKGRASLLPLLVFLLLLASEAVSGQEIELRLGTSGNTIRADVSFQWAKKEELLGYVRGGLGSRVEFHFRIQEKHPTIFAIFQEVLVSETSLARSASYDIFSDKYSVTSEREGKAFYTTADDFLLSFFSVRDCAVFNGLRSGTTYAVTVQVRLTPIQLIPPLNIISLFGGMATFTSPWVRQEVHP
jgi:hypothetical protein